ncbi:methyltransferase domain-containing protein [Croceibacterium ferulae]|uniref:methyltransferase domain-containing protein n=1 Tax=Croceibacterium ferulae TaxID=1854641 RepID=UPI000EAFE593|nr:methyltransferase domain-containing protein [Croceibacterium ferulae]
MDLARRSRAPELMDADDLPAETYVAIMRDLARVNAVTLAPRPTLRFLDRVAQRRSALRILDVGFGDGDMLRRIERWATRRGITVALTGVDLNPRSEQAARAHTPAESSICWVTGDYADLAGQGWDVILSSLVAHHMNDDELVAFLRFMEREAAAGWFVNDLLRHRFAHAGYPLLARLARWHPIVRHDGTLSIARSFRPAEWLPLLAAAGVAQAQVRREFPFRLCVERLR